MRKPAWIQRFALLSACLFAATASTACRGGDGDDDDTQPDAMVIPGGMTIYDVQDPTNIVPLDGAVALDGVVVAAIDNYGARTGNIFIMEPDGGAYSGVLVFGVDLSVVAGLQVGDLINLSGAVKTEFALVDDTSGRTTTELVPVEGGVIAIEKVGTGTVPAPQVVDALAIAAMPDQTARDAEWEKWEGVLIQANNITQVNNVRMIGDDPMFLEFGSHGSLRVDTSLAAFPAGFEVGAGVDTCLASVTGIGDYFFNYKILPRTSTDVVGGGTGCAIENGALCDDGIDNDYDYGFTGAFVDCEDRGCQLDPAAGCQTDTTVVDIQNGTVTGVVSVNDVVITAVDKNNRNFWVADALTGAEFNGVYVYRGGNGTPPLGNEFVVGATIDLSGTVSEFDLNGSTGDTLTEITFPTFTFVSAPGAAPTPATPAVTEVATIAGGEGYEGVLVTIDALEVVDSAEVGNKVEFVAGATTLFMDDDAFAYAQATFVVGTCYQITGVMNVQLADDQRTINPRSVADIAVSTNCN